MRRSREVSGKELQHGLRLADVTGEVNQRQRGGGKEQVECDPVEGAARKRPRFPLFALVVVCVGFDGFEVAVAHDGVHQQGNEEQGIGCEEDGVHGWSRVVVGWFTYT